MIATRIENNGNLLSTQKDNWGKLMSLLSPPSNDLIIQDYVGSRRELFLGPVDENVTSRNWTHNSNISLWDDGIMNDFENV